MFSFFNPMGSPQDQMPNNLAPLSKKEIVADMEKKEEIIHMIF